MAEEYIKIKISAMTEASTIEGLITYGVIGGQPYKVPIALLKGNKGDTGANIELQKTSTHLQWRPVGGTTWTNLVALDDLKGAKGDTGSNIELQKSATHLQWRVVGATEWTNLVILTDLKGATGDPGKDFQIKGYYATLAALESAVPSPAAGDAYGVGSASPYDIYIYDGVSQDWINNGAIQGAAGASAFVYIAYASDDQGSDFSATDGNYMAIKATTTAISSPQASDFAGLWKLVKPAAGTTIAFTQAGTKENIASGETLAVLFGKLMKWFASFGALAWLSNIDYTGDIISNKPTIPTVTNDFTNDYKAVIDFMEGKESVTSLADLPVTKRSVLCTLSSASTLSLGSTLAEGREIHIRVANSTASAITITLPTTGDYISKKNDGTNIGSVTLPASGSLEINIWSVNSKYYIRTNA